MVKFLKLYLIFELYLLKMSKLFSPDEHCTKLKDKNFPVADVNVFQGFENSVSKQLGKNRSINRTPRLSEY